MQLRDTLSRTLRKAGPNSGAAVYDLTTHQELFALREDTRRPPASLEKLYTTVALLSELGPKFRLSTAELGGGHRAPNGTWHGSLYLRGGGDPTFGDAAFNRVWEFGFGPSAAQLASQLAAEGIRRVTGTVFGDASLFDSRRGGPSSGFAADIANLGGQLSALTYDHGATRTAPTPEAFAARQLALAMHAAHIPTRASRVSAVAPPGTTELASVSSPPLSVLTGLMDAPSDDFFAEMLTKQLGVQVGGAGTTAAGAGVIAHAVESYGLRPTIVDGSGLARSNRSSPRQIVGLLRAVWRTPVGNGLWSSLPVVGFNGTVRNLARGTAAQDQCLAKTGTLSGVTNLAGYCHSRGHKLLAFALFLDGPDNARGLSLIGNMVAAIARY
jgi:D-alanyl-D-alanine carboxypeptidase/D-alanyl-D-alanine-endopeptidase (penicillin-binding protein 4)